MNYNLSENEITESNIRDILSGMWNTDTITINNIDIYYFVDGL